MMVNTFAISQNSMTHLEYLASWQQEVLPREFRIGRRISRFRKVPHKSEVLLLMCMHVLRRQELYWTPPQPVVIVTTCM